MNKTIDIKKSTIRNFLLSLIIGFSVLYGLEHFGKFSYITNSPTEYDEYGRVKMITYTMGTTKVASIFYDSYFGNKIETKGNGFDVGDLNYSETDFDKYEVKSYYYTQATIAEYKYGLYISLGLFLITFYV
jgi:hypothetical protein